MNEETINNIAALLDKVFGRPGSTGIALENLALLNTLAEEIRKRQQTPSPQTFEETPKKDFK